MTYVIKDFRTRTAGGVFEPKSQRLIQVKVVRQFRERSSNAGEGCQVLVIESFRNFYWKIVLHRQQWKCECNVLFSISHRCILHQSSKRVIHVRWFVFFLERLLT